jgi:integrase/recombinase XerD
MVNTVTCKIILRKDQVSDRGLCTIAAQCFVNRQRIVIPLAKVEMKYFDASREMVKPSCQSAVSLNKIIGDARYRALIVLSDANVKNIQLNRHNFRTMFTQTQPDLDFIMFYEQEMNKRVGELQGNSMRLHKKTLNKLRKFRSSIPFSTITPQLLADFERFLVAKCGNNVNTVYSEIKNVRAYIYIAMKKGVEIQNPFLNFKLKRGGSRLIFLTLDELTTILHKFDSNEFPPHVRQSALIYLVSAFTSLRISDVRRIDEDWIKECTLSYRPHKTRRFNKYVNIPLSEIAIRILRIYLEHKRVYKIKTDQRINDDLKLIAAFCGITKPLSMHVGRHTFATTFLELGGSIEVLKEIMGHSSINETMCYAHITDKRKEMQMANFNHHFN